MNRLTLLVFVFVLLSGCKKQPDILFLWEKEMGPGKFLSSAPTSDSLFVVCGEEESYPVVYKMSRSGKIVSKFKEVESGAFTSVVSDSNGYYVAGSIGTDLIVSRFTHDLKEIWSIRESVGITGGEAVIAFESESQLLVAVSLFAADFGETVSPLYLARIDTTGIISDATEVNGTHLNGVGSVIIKDGNIYAASTTAIPGGRSKASLAKYSSDLVLLWETSFFNNPGFAAGAIHITESPDGNFIVTGFTELPASPDPVLNSWASAVSPSGSIIWKSYLEVANSGEEIRFVNGSLILANMNCMILNILDKDNGDLLRTEKIFNACDPKNTGSKGHTMASDYKGRVLLAGERGGNLYLVYTDPFNE